MKKLILFLFGVVLILNFTSIPQFLGLEPTIKTYRYTGMTGIEFTEIPAKGKKIDFDRPGLKRKFEMHLWKVWNWREYLMHERWQLEYCK